MVGDATRVPCVSDWGSEIDMTHPLAAYRGARHLHAALVTDDTFVTDVLVLAAVALIVFGGAKYGLTEETVLFGT
jgi:hypothetical protein